MRPGGERGAPARAGRACRGVRRSARRLARLAAGSSARGPISGAHLEAYLHNDVIPEHQGVPRRAGRRRAIACGRRMVRGARASASAASAAEEPRWVGTLGRASSARQLYVHPKCMRDASAWLGRRGFARGPVSLTCSGAPTRQHRQARQSEQQAAPVIPHHNRCARCPLARKSFGYAPLCSEPHGR